jgi:hypothetical protein
MCKAFPVLIEDAITLLADISPPSLGSLEAAMNSESRLSKAIKNTFTEVVRLKQPAF